MSGSLRLVVGLGKTGFSIARYLTRRNMTFILFDTRKNPQGVEDFKQEFPGVDIFLERFPENILNNVREIITSPGISLEEPLMQKAQRENIPICGDIECLAREIKVPVIAITGTNGKSTVTTLVGEMVKESGLTVAVAGNIGLPVLDILDIGVAYDAWVLELSSFQLEVTNSLKPLSATILNVTPDHLDRHHTLEAYSATKQRIYQNADNIVFSREDCETKPGKHNASLISFGLDEPKDNNWGIRLLDGENYLSYANELVLPVKELKIKGQHNWLNALAACALAQSLNIPINIMKNVLTRFRGLSHRSELVRTLDGVDWINDSKGTNIGATISSITGIGGSILGKIILIAGGEGKGADFSELSKSVDAFVQSAILIGTDADKIESAIENSTEVVHAPSLDKAIKIAKLKAQPGDVVLLSPACASFDMFRDFNHRGDEFISLVQAL